MKNKIHSLLQRKYFLIGISTVLITILLLGYFFWPYILSRLNNFTDAISEKNTADLYIQGEKVFINFKITNRDRKNADKFLQRLGVDEKIENASFQFDQDNIKEFSKILPTKLTLYFTEGDLKFKNNSGILLKSFMSSQKYEFATGSSKSTLIFGTDRDFNLEVIDPEPVLKFATISGKLHLSKKIDPLFPILSKIGKIYLKVKNKDIEGEITLKN